MITVGQQLEKEYLSSFNCLLDKTIDCLMDTYKDSDHLKNHSSWEQFEKASVQAIGTVQKQNKGEIFANWPVELIGGNKFPDIVLDLQKNKKFGVEVKTTKGNTWKTLGGSIMESTRIQDVERINILFAKMTPLEIKHKNFEDCISDVAVTHSPRYLIDFEVSPQETIFKKINASYAEVWQSKQPFDFFRKYFLEKAKREKNGVWWIGNEDKRDLSELPGVQIQFFSELTASKKIHLITRAMLLYPQIFTNQADYREVAIWFFNMGIMNSSLRDTFSAGSKVKIDNIFVPRKYIRLEQNYHLILKMISGIDSDNALMEEYSTDDPLTCLKNWQKRMFKYVPSDYHFYLNRIFAETNL